MFMLPTVFSVPNSYHPDISLSSSWSLSEDCEFTPPDNQTISSTATPITTSMATDPNSNVNMSLAAADRARNHK